MSTIHCPKCHQEYELDDTIMGCNVQCAVCNTKFIAQQTINDDIQTSKKESSSFLAEPSCGTTSTKPETIKVKKRKGCRLVFLIILVLLVMAVVFIAFVIFGPPSNEDRTARAMTELQMLDDAIQQYRLDVGYYPSNLQCLLENFDQVERWDGPYYILPKVPRDPWDSEYQYIIPGDYGEYDLYSFGADKQEGGEGINADISLIPCGPHLSLLSDWKARKLAEIRGEMPSVDDPTKYNTAIELPNNKAFKNLALQKANDQRYIKLRHQGMNNEQIANYIMREEMLPLIREATGKQNILPSMKLTEENMKVIKENMLDLQMAAAQRRMNRIDPSTGISNSENWSLEYQKQYREQLSKNWDTYIKALQKQNPMDNKAVQDAINASSFRLNK